MYEHLTFEAIRDEMLSKVPDKFDKREGSIAYSTLAPVALVLSQFYKRLETAVNNCYADTAEMEFLIKIAKSRGVYPYPATNAKLYASFTPVHANVEGKRFTCGQLSYVVTEHSESGESVVVCEQAGAVGNSNQNLQLLPVDYIEGLVEATLKEIAVPGEDAESLEVFRDRVVNAYRSFGGNVPDYKRVALSVAEVFGVKVLPCSGEDVGVVKLYIQGYGYKPAASNVIANVLRCFLGDAYNPGLLPVGHTLEVYPAEAVVIPVSFELTLNDGYYHEDVISIVEEKTKLYFLELRKQWGKQRNTEGLIIYSSRLYYDTLSVEGVKDVIVHLGEGATTANYQLSPLQIPFMNGEQYA